MLDELVKVIETLQKRIADHGDTLRENETRTRMALIDPLLKVLGWDTADPSLVTPEYRVNVGWADYALRGLGNNPVAVIEAKRLGSVVENHLDQAVNYCIQQGIHYAGVTDGSHWQVYRTFDPVPLAEKLKLDITIASTPTHEVALKLLLLWRPNLASGQAEAANEPIFQETDGTSTAKDVGGTSSEALSNGSWTLISQLPENVSWRNQPSAIRFPNGEEQQIVPTKWKFVLVAVAEWLIQNGSITKDMCPVQLDAERYLIHTQPLHSNGKPFLYPAQLSNGLSIISRPTAKKAVESCTLLMKLCSQDPSQVYLKLDK